MNTKIILIGLFRGWFGLALVLAVFAGPLVAKAETGGDVAEVFSRARNGEPLRLVALGGSITQAGSGWIGDWLRQKFPKSLVTVANSGMSATGSALGIFRVERDVIAHQPDLVLMEFCVNDSGLGDEEAIRYVESIVVRLKQLPHPPAIVCLEAATRDGVNLKRHRAVAQRYGLLEVNLQEAVNEHLKQEQLAWEALFGDDVHPNEKGHEFYAKVISEALEPLTQESGKTATSKLPPPLSPKPLILDGTMVRLSDFVTKDWKTENAPASWWGRFFVGTLDANQPGATLRVPVRGTTVGILYPMMKTYGRFLASVDGGTPQEIAPNTRGGYDFRILTSDLPAQEHLVEFAVPTWGDAADGKPVKLGYLLVAGQTKVNRDSSEQGHFSAERQAALKFSKIPADQWKWTGPFAVADAKAAIQTPFPPEKPGDSTVQWQPLPTQEADWIDFQPMAKAPAIVYAATEVEAAQEEEVIIGLAADYYGQLWVNDKPVLNLGDGHGHASVHQFVPATLKAGKNRILLKLGSGTQGFGFSIFIGHSPLIH